FQAEDGIRDPLVTGVQTCALPISKKKANAVYAQLKSGGDFVAIARKVSDDGQTAKVGGQMGVISPGMLPPELDAQVFAAKKGDRSEERRVGKEWSSRRTRQKTQKK